ncbi:MAG: hypothetical protein HOP13_12255 [Alphaproteobacteria bacterium]|nr:hypothetical protein [Alphaproteobacteria bacterium]
MTEQPSGDSFGRFIGLLLMGIAVLWMAFCGLCAFGMLASVFTEGSEMLGLALFVLVIAGAAAAGGYAVFIAGRSLWRS